MDSGSDHEKRPDFHVFNKNCSKSDEDEADQHLNLNMQDQTYTPVCCQTGGALRFPDKRPDEGYLVLENERGDPPEEPVRQKPHGAGGRVHVHRCPDTSDSDTSQGGGGGGAGGACVRINRQTKQESSLGRDSPIGATGYTADDDVEPEGNTVYHDVTASVAEIQHPITTSKTIIEKVPHALFCNGVSRWKIRPHRFPVVLRGFLKFAKYGIKITNFTLHCRGLDQDYNQHYATLTAVVYFQPECRLARRLLEFTDCRVKLTVEVFVESAERGRNLGIACGEKRLQRDERDSHKMHITVYKVVDLDEIVYNLSEVCPDNIILKITASIEASRIQVSAADSACGFVDISTSVERLPSL